MLCVELGWTEKQLRSDNTQQFLEAIFWVFEQRRKKQRFNR